MRIGLFVAVLNLLFSNSVLAKNVELWGLDQPVVITKVSKDAKTSSADFTAKINKAALSERAGRALQVSLPNGVMQTLRITRLTKEQTGGFYLNGTFENNAGGMSLYYGLNSIFGTLWADGKSYNITGTAKDGAVSISQATDANAVDLSDDAIRLPKGLTGRKAATPNASKAAPAAGVIDSTLDYL